MNHVTHCSFRFFIGGKLAARLGVEPRQNESESFVLPLHNRAKKGSRNSHNRVRATFENWSRRWDSNPQPPVYKTGALPLSYAGLRFFMIKLWKIMWRISTPGFAVARHSSDSAKINMAEKNMECERTPVQSQHCRRTSCVFLRMMAAGGQANLRKPSPDMYCSPIFGFMTRPRESRDHVVVVRLIPLTPAD